VDTITFRVEDGAGSATGTASITVMPAPPASAAIYVASAVFESRGARHDERVVVTVRQAPAGDQPRSSDPIVRNAAVTIEVRDGAGALVRRLKNTTNREGRVRTPWLRGLPPGTYTATVTALGHPTLPWSATLGLREVSHTLPH
jgi:hypothetical protein